MKFLDRFKKKTNEAPNFMKILPVGADLFHAHRRTDMTRLTVAFHTFATAPKNCCITRRILRCFYILERSGCWCTVSLVSLTVLAVWWRNSASHCDRQVYSQHINVFGKVIMFSGFSNVSREVAWLCWPQLCALLSAWGTNITESLCNAILCVGLGLYAYKYLFLWIFMWAFK